MQQISISIFTSFEYRTLPYRLNMCKLYFYAVIKITVLLSELIKWLVRKLTDEVDGDGGEFCLGQGINESLLFDTALDMGVHHNT